jgi:Delta6-protoilludene synthase
MEEARGLASHNLVSVVKNQYNLDLAGAFEWVECLGKARISQFLSDMKLVSSWEDEDLDKKVNMYIDGLGCWIRGIDVWSFESMRYFDDGLSVQKNRLIRLRSRENGYVKAHPDQKV